VRDATASLHDVFFILKFANRTALVQLDSLTRSSILPWARQCVTFIFISCTVHAARTSNPPNHGLVLFESRMHSVSHDHPAMRDPAWEIVAKRGGDILSDLSWPCASPPLAFSSALCAMSRADNKSETRWTNKSHIYKL